MTKEPIYEYKKGEGWVIKLGPREFTVGWIRPDEERAAAIANDWFSRHEHIKSFDHFVDFIANLPHYPAEWDPHKLNSIWGTGHDGDVRYFRRYYTQAQEEFNTYCPGPCCVEGRLNKMKKFWTQHL